MEVMILNEINNMTDSYFWEIWNILRIKSFKDNFQLIANNSLDNQNCNYKYNIIEKKNIMLIIIIIKHIERKKIEGFKKKQ